MITINNTDKDSCSRSGGKSFVISKKIKKKKRSKTLSCLPELSEFQFFFF